VIRAIKNLFVFSFICFLGTIAGLPASHTASAASYGAIAYATSSGVWGYSYGYSSRGGAESRALRECRSRGRGCRAIVWFREACGALATGRNNGYGWAWNTSRRAARQRAMAECRNRTSGCRIRVDVCSR
jgi:serine/threonine-protein kinase